MFNISKQTLWFIIILSISISIYYIFNIDSVEYPNIDVDFEKETSYLIRKKLNRQYSQNKKIHTSPKKIDISILSMKKKLTKKLDKSKSIKKKLDKSKLDKSKLDKKKLTKKSNIQIKLFFAEWCGHCKTFKPIWNNIKLKYGNNDKISFDDVDCTNNSPNLPYIQGFPTIAIYKDDNYIENYENNRTFEDFEEYINNLL